MFQEGQMKSAAKWLPVLWSSSPVYISVLSGWISSTSTQLVGYLPV